MQLTPMITFRGIERSAALEADIEKRIDRLNMFYPALMGCRVLVEPSQRHHRRGNHFHVRIDLTVPGGEVVVSHDPSLRGAAQDARQVRLERAQEVDPGRKDAFLAVREAFDIARRRLQDYGRKQRGDVKTAATLPAGRIARLFPDDGYGFIEAEDGHEVYFQQSSLVGSEFDDLTIGSRVVFAEESGDEGPQASTVKVKPRPSRRRVPRA
jgi:cold shock CspA family protein